MMDYNKNDSNKVVQTVYDGAGNARTDVEHSHSEVMYKLSLPKRMTMNNDFEEAVYDDNLEKRIVEDIIRMTKLGNKN